MHADPVRDDFDPPARDAGTRVVGLPGPAERRALRAGDDDRRRVTDLLQAHYVAGRLAQTEFESRLHAAIGARTFGDLDGLLADLPDVGPATSMDAASARPSSGAAEQRPAQARRGAGRCGEASFRAHATSYLLVMVLLVAIWALTSPGGYFWPVWPMLGWGIGLASHGLAARTGSRTRGLPAFGSR